MAGGDGLSTTHPRGRAPWRGLSALLVALAVALVAHGLGLHWIATRLLQPPPLRPVLPEPVFTRLLAPQEPAPLPPAGAAAPAPVATPQPPPAGLVAAAKPAAEPASAPQPASAPAAVPTTGSTASPTAGPTPLPAAAPAPAPAETAALPAPPPAPPVAATTPPADPLAALWPQDARIHYVLDGQFRGGPLFGSARVQWVRSGTNYQAQVEIRLPLGNTLVYTSQGRIDADGLVPTAYEEARGSRRRQTRMTDTEVVMQDGKTLARPPGLQDMASQFIELGHRLRTGRLPPTLGGSLSLPLARPGGIDLWTYDINAQALVRTPRLGEVAALRLTPRPVAGGRNQVSAEFWFAPSLQYLPARVRVSMGEEAFVDLVVESIEQR